MPPGRPGLSRAALVRQGPLLAVLTVAGCGPRMLGPGRQTAIAPDDFDVPYVPTPPAMVMAMLDLARVGAGDHVIDLGSGDGRIALAAGRRGATALGVEIESTLVQRATAQAAAEGIGDRVRFSRGDLFATPIREASVVTLYLLPRVNLALRPRLLTELRPGTRIVSHAFDMGDWANDDSRTVDHRIAYLWIVPAVVGGDWLLTLSDGTTRPLAIMQRYQTLVGTLDGRLIEESSLSGTALGFTATLDGRRSRFQGVVGERTIEPDPAAPAEALRGWIARRQS